MADEKLRRGAKTKTEVLLSDIWNKLSALGGGGGSGLATESTLISVLNAIVASDQDIEILLVRDTGDSDVVLQQITNYETGTPVITYKDVNGNTVTPVGPLEYLDPSAVLNLVLAAIQAQGTVPQATEATLDAINSVNQDILTAAENLDIKTDVNLSTRASEATLNAIKTNLDGVLRANLLTRVGAGATGTVSSARSVSFQNDGSVNATIGGALLYPGQSISISAGGENDTLAPIFYQAGGAGADLLISIIQ